jgi:hypothetical protein
MSITPIFIRDGESRWSKSGLQDFGFVGHAKLVGRSSAQLLLSLVVLGAGVARLLTEVLRTK